MRNQAFVSADPGQSPSPSGRRTYPMVPCAPPLLDASERLRSLATIKRCRREQEICHQDCFNDNWHQVVSGMARKCITLADGRRQIVDILLPGDCFGFTPGDHRQFSVQAITNDTVVKSYPRPRIMALAQSDPEVAQELLSRALETIVRLQEQLLVLGRVSAAEKVRTYLIFMHRRLPSKRDHVVSLPFSRYEIADQLGISVETVCRAITGLQHAGAIALEGRRQVRILHTADVGYDPMA